MQNYGMSKAAEPTLKFQVLPGNNSQLVRQVLNATRSAQWFETASVVEGGKGVAF
jgi:hypothetical protein